MGACERELMTRSVRLRASTKTWSAGTKWYLLAVLFLTAVISYTDRLILNVLVEPLKKDLLLNDTQVSVLQGAAFAVIYALAALPIGRLTDLINRRNLLLAGIGIWSVGMAWCAFSTSFHELFAARVLVGLGEAGVFPAGVSLLVARFPPQLRATAIGLFFMGSALGSGVAIFGGGLLLGLFTATKLSQDFAMFGAWRRVLLSLVIPGVLIFVLLLFVREPPREQTKATALRQWTFASGLSTLWNVRRVVGFLLCAQTLQAIVDYASSAWMPTLLARKFHMAPSVVGLRLGSVVLVAAAIGPTLGGIVSDRLQACGGTNTKPALAGFAFFICVPLTWCCFAHSAWASILLFGALTLTMGIGIIAAVSSIQDAVDDAARGTAIALQAFLCTIIGLGGGPTLVAVLSDKFFRDATGVGSAMAVVMAPGLMLAGMAALGAYRSCRGYRLIGSRP